MEGIGFNFTENETGILGKIHAIIFQTSQNYHSSQKLTTIFNGIKQFPKVTIFKKFTGFLKSLRKFQ